MKEGRRGFLKGLGKLAAAAPLVVIPIAATEVPIETKEPETGFRFQCDCGADILGPVPKEPGWVVIKCPSCGTNRGASWIGTHWNIAGVGVASLPAPMSNEVSLEVTAMEGVHAMHKIKTRKKDPNWKPKFSNG